MESDVHDHSGGDREASASLQGAASWFARRTAGLSKEERLQFDAWLDASKDNRDAFLSIEHAWNIAGSAKTESSIERMRREALQYRGNDEKRTVWQRYAALAATLIVAVLLGAAIYRPPLSHLFGRGVEDKRLVFETTAGQRKRLILTDGTVITLNSKSRIAISPSSTRRASLLAGEALFDVAKDPEDPFILSMENYRVTVLGTLFNVRLSQDRVKITLAEGRIEFDRQLNSNATGRPDEHVRLKPGEQLVADANGIAVSDVNVADIMMWEKGRIRFRNTPIPDAVAEMARYSSSPVRIDDPDLSAYRVSGTFRTANPKAFITALTETFPLDASDDGATTVIRRKKN